MQWAAVRRQCSGWHAAATQQRTCFCSHAAAAAAEQYSGPLPPDSSSVPCETAEVGAAADAGGMLDGNSVGDLSSDAPSAGAAQVCSKFVSSCCRTRACWHSVHTTWGVLT